MEILARQPKEESHLRATAFLQSLSLGSRAAVSLGNRLLRRRPNLYLSVKRLLANASIILALPLRLVIFIYQKTLSPDHGLPRGLFPYGYCKFYPSCSAFAALVLKQQGIIGLPKIIRRLIKCRPGKACAVDLP